MFQYSGFSQVFWDASEWNNNKAEILSYQVVKPYLGKEINFEAIVITEGIHYHSTRLTSSRKLKPKYKPAIRNTFNFSFTREFYEKSVQAELIFSRTINLPLVREQVSVQDWNNPIARKLYSENGNPVLKFNSAYETETVIVFDKTPIFSLEQLFTYLRNIPFKTGHQEAIWFIGSLTEDQSPKVAHFASIKVLESRFFKEKPVRFIKLELENGTVYDFYMAENGIHQVVFALFPDKTTWTLTGIEFKRYWFFE